jgi:Fe2+ transport system protein FeoA
LLLVLPKFLQHQKHGRFYTYPRSREWEMSMDKKTSNQSVKGNEPSFPLALAGTGEKVRVVLIRGGANLKERLLSMGIQVDDTIEVIQPGKKGAILIARDENRFMLGGGMAQKIYVTKE